eukprot:6218875-Amphidinium_carterae.1
MESWLSEVLYPCDIDELPSAEELQDLWVALGCDVETVELLVKMRVLFRINENRLMVLREVIASDSFVSDITRALLVCWKMDAYTESRWLTLGKAGRSYTRAHLLGFGSIMEHAKEKRTVSMYQAGGYDRKSVSVALLFTLLALVAAIPETLLARLFKDNRLALYASQALSSLKTELERIAGMRPFVWESIAAMLELSPEQYKGMVIRSSYRSLAFIEDKLLNKACHRPWSLTHGDITGKLQQLMEEEEEPVDLITQKMYTLLHRGFPIEKIRFACVLLGQCSWTSYMSEKLHASVAVVRRHHPDLTIQSLQLRAFAHSFNQFVKKATIEEAQIKRLVKKKDATLAKQTNRITGRHMYFARKCHEMAKANRARGRDDAPMKAERVMKIAAEHWRQHSGRHQDRYEKEAAETRRRRERELADQYEDITGRLEMLSQRIQLNELKDDTSTTMVFSTVAFTDKDIIRFQNVYELFGRNIKHVVSKTTEQLGMIKPITTQSFMDAQNSSLIYPAACTSEYSDVAKQIIRLREFFVEAVFVLDPSGSARHFAFVLATQRPYKLILRPLETCQPATLPRAKSVGDWREVSAAERTFAWKHDGNDCLTMDVFSDTNADYVGVIMRTFYIGCDCIEAREHLMPLAQVLDNLRLEIKPQANIHGGNTNPSKTHRGDIAVDRPWLQQLDTQVRKGKREMKEVIADDVHEEGRDEDSGIEEADEVWKDHASVLQAVKDARTAYETKKELRLRMFKVSLLGGRWQMERTGRSVYGLRCDVVKGTVVDSLATVWGMRKSASFEYNVYSNAGAEVLVDAWMERMEHVALVWEAHGGSTSAFPAKSFDTSGYSRELEERFVALNERCRSRFAQYGNIWPCGAAPAKQASSSTGA